MAVILLAAAWLLVAYLTSTTIYNLFFHPLAKLPGPFFARISTIPSFYHACKGDRHIWHWQNFEVYGRKYRSAPNAVVFNTPDAYNSIYSFKANVKRAKFYDAWPRNKDDVHVLGTTDVALHARKRRLLNQAFSDRSVKASGTFMAKHIDRWNELLQGEPAERDSEGWSPAQNLATWGSYLTFDVLGDLAFGASFDTKESGENAFKKMPPTFDAFVKFNYPITRLPFVEWIIWLKPRGLDVVIEAFMPQDIKDYYAFVERIVTKRVAEEREREARKKLVEREDILHFLCTAKDPDTGDLAFDSKELLAEANLLILAGSDSTTSTISSIFFYVTHNPRVYQKLAKEIREKFHSVEEIVHGPKLLTECQYLRACIDETLRMAPAAPSELPREVLPGGTIVDGEFYPGGVIVGTPNWSMGHNGEHYGDANTFRPERWIVSDYPESMNTEEEVQQLKRGLHTFLKGPGDCIGQKFAMLQLSMVVARTLWRMEVRTAPGTDLGAGDEALGWGRRDPRVYMLEDAYISLREGPVVQFKPRPI